MLNDTEANQSRLKARRTAPTALREKGGCKMTEQLKFLSECVTQSGSIKYISERLQNTVYRRVLT